MGGGVLVIFILTSCKIFYRKGTLRDVEMTQAEASAEEDFKDKLKRMVLEKTEDPVCAFLYIDGSREEDSYITCCIRRVPTYRDLLNRIWGR